MTESNTKSHPESEETVGQPIDRGDETTSDTRGLALHTKILIGLAAGAILGIGSNFLSASNPGASSMVQWIASYITDPVGQVFLRMLFMVVVPLVFASLSLGVSQLGDLRKLGRIGAKVLTYFLLVTVLATTIGLGLVNTVRPGVGFSPEIQAQLMQTFGSEAEQRGAQARSGQGFGINTFVNIIPRNPIDAAARTDMLAVIFFALVFGVALTLIPREKSEPVQRLLDGIGEAIIKIVGFAMKIAPFAVAALIFSTTARFGWGVLKSLLWYAVCVIVGLLIHQFFIYSILVRVFAKLNPLTFFRKVTPVRITAFSTSSSNATLPTSIKAAEEELGVPPQIAGFVLPLGATMNMNGTALFEGVTCVFLAQVFGVPLGVTEQIIVILLSVLMAVGAAGVPGGSIPLLMIVLDTIGVPPGGIAIVLGVDRILDMSRTVPNVTGDLTCAVYIARSEGAELSPARAVVGAAAD
jgi:dicarboxylate/amino acid:cation (Na+ or H+) symporter, DAACS family